MSCRNGLRSRALVLGLSITSMGAQAVAVDAMAAAPAVDLAGLVASDGATAVGTSATEPEGCDPSGCGSAYYEIRDFSFGDAGGASRYGDIVTGFVSAWRYFGATVVDAQLDIQVISDAEIIAAPGCAVVTPQLATCALGDLVTNAQTANTFSVKLTGNSLAQIRATLRSPTVNQATGTALASIYSDQGNAALARTTRVEQESCPLASAHLSYVLSNGEPAWSTLAGLTPRVHEASTFVPAMFDEGPVPLSIAVVMDDSAAVDAGSWQAAKNAVVGFIQDWSAWSGSKSRPFPAIAIYGMASQARLVEYSTNASNLALDVQALARRERGSAWYATVDRAGSDLGSRDGRRVVVILATGTDSSGGVLRNAVTRRLVDAQVNVYGVAGDLIAEPALRDLARATSGFRQRPDLDGGSYSALGKINRQIRSERRATWISPDAAASYRQVDVELQNSSGGSQAVFTSGYTPAGSACAAVCRVTRSLPERAAPLVPYVVRLSFPAALSTYTTVIEQLPYSANLNVSSISDGGYYDFSTRTISWSLPPGTPASGISYTVATSWSQSEPLYMQGRSSASGSSVSTCGDAQFSFVRPHPAAISFNFGIDSMRLRGYAQAWRSGMPWITNEPAMIRVAHVTRGFQIQRMGNGSYDYDPLADVPWVSTAGSASMATVAFRSRILPSSFTSGTPFSVVLGYTSSLEAGAGAIEETPPAGWAISNISDGGVYDSHSRTIRWGVFTGSINRSVSYTLTPPAGASDPALFDGRVSVDGNDAEFTETTLSSSANDVIFRAGFDG